MKRLAQGSILMLCVLLSFICLIDFSHATNSTRQNQNGNQSPPREAATLYAQSCARCHGRDGRGRTFRGRLVRARDFTDAAWQTDVTDEHLFNSIKSGRGRMPAFGRRLSDEEVNALVAFVRRFKT